MVANNTTKQMAAICGILLKKITAHTHTHTHVLTFCQIHNFINEYELCSQRQKNRQLLGNFDTFYLSKLLSTVCGLMRKHFSKCFILFYVYIVDYQFLPPLFSK